MAMSEPSLTYAELVAARLGELATVVKTGSRSVAVDVDASRFSGVARRLRDHDDLQFQQLIDLAGIDYLGLGDDEWATRDVTHEGFSRGVEGQGSGRIVYGERPSWQVPERRFAVIVQLLSLRHNRRVRLRAFCADDALPSLPSLTEIWPVANWFEREAFDLFGIAFEGHPDLRRILTDYGFVGHPFRKDFPLIGNIEVRFDPVRNRVIHEPVSIEPRVLVPRVIRDDSRYEQSRAEEADREGDSR